METPVLHPRGPSWLCAGLALLAGVLAALSTWLVLVPPSQGRASRVVPGTPAGVAACVAEKLRAGTLETVDAGVSILGDDNESTTRVMFDGTVRLRLVVTLMEAGAASVEAMTTPLSVIDLSPRMEKIIEDCTAP